MNEEHEDWLKNAEHYEVLLSIDSPFSNEHDKKKFYCDNGQRSLELYLKSYVSLVIDKDEEIESTHNISHLAGTASKASKEIYDCLVNRDSKYSWLVTFYNKFYFTDGRYPANKTNKNDPRFVSFYKKYAHISHEKIKSDTSFILKIIKKELNIMKEKIKNNNKEKLLHDKANIQYKTM